MTDPYTFSFFAPLHPPASLRETLRVTTRAGLRAALQAGLCVSFSSSLRAVPERTSRPPSLKLWRPLNVRFMTTIRFGRDVGFAKSGAGPYRRFFLSRQAS